MLVLEKIIKQKIIHSAGKDPVKRGIGATTVN